jgi:hypothetical protein
MIQRTLIFCLVFSLSLILNCGSAETKAEPVAEPAKPTVPNPKASKKASLGENYKKRDRDSK